MEWNIACETCFNPLKPCVVKTEFLPTISKKYQADKWWQWRKILIMQGITSWSNAKILQKDITGIVWRITNEVLGLKGLTKLALFSWGKKNQASGNLLNDLLVFGSNGNIFQFKVIRVNPPLPQVHGWIRVEIRSDSRLQGKNIVLLHFEMNWNINSDSKLKLILPRKKNRLSTISL